APPARRRDPPSPARAPGSSSPGRATSAEGRGAREKPAGGGPRHNASASASRVARPRGSSVTLARPTRAANRRSSTASPPSWSRSEEHTSELQSLTNLVCRLLLEKKKDCSVVFRHHGRRR